MEFLIVFVLSMKALGWAVFFGVLFFVAGYTFEDEILNIDHPWIGGVFSVLLFGGSVVWIVRELAPKVVKWLLS